MHVPSAPRGEGTKPPSHTTTLVFGESQFSIIGATGMRVGAHSMKVVSLKFGEAQCLFKSKSFL